jgi:hypothetical protein
VLRAESSSETSSTKPPGSHRKSDSRTRFPPSVPGSARVYDDSSEDDQPSGPLLPARGNAHQRRSPWWEAGGRRRSTILRPVRKAWRKLLRLPYFPARPFTIVSLAACEPSDSDCSVTRAATIPYGLRRIRRFPHTLPHVVFQSRQGGAALARILLCTSSIHLSSSPAYAVGSRTASGVCTAFSTSEPGVISTRRRLLGRVLHGQVFRA